ncbi:MAG: MFS transporter, partial [Actinobacteria bacterium]
MPRQCTRPRHRDGHQNRLVRKTPLSGRQHPVTVSEAVSRDLTGRRLGLLGREPSFRSLFLATFGSGLGTWLALVALQIDVLRRTHSPLWMSALLIADILPTLLVGLLAAPLVDRLSRRALLIGADVVRFGVFCALPFAPNATTIVALAAVIGIATG